MLPLLILTLVPMVFAEEVELKVNNYILEIDECRTLKRIRSTKESTSELDLSSLGLECLDKDVFRDLDNVRILNLANNSLYGVPAFVFANLTNLEHLSLADNKMRRFESTFVGLGNLKSLNISNNPLKSLWRGYLHGLTKSTDILTMGNNIGSISSLTFEKADDLVQPKRRIRRSVNDPTDYIIDIRTSKPDSKGIGTPLPYYKQTHRLKVCIREGRLKLIEKLEKEDSLPSDCTQMEMTYYNPSLLLTNLNITSFEKGWYGLKSEDFLGIRSIILDDNNVSRLTSDLLNDLPASVRIVSLERNRIERLEEGIIGNSHIASLYLGDNVISEIQDGALEKTRLTGLYLVGNRLRDTKFAASLPSTLQILRLDRNAVAELAAGSFSKLNEVIYVHLEGNNITSLQKDSLLGLSSVKLIDLSNNGLNKIEPGSFQHLQDVQNLLLAKNGISSIEKGAFDGLETSLILNLSFNKFTKITKDTLPDLPKNLEHLYLDHNEIESLEVGAFVNLPKNNLALNGNKISKIEKGSFDLPALETLTLTGNLLSHVDGDSFEGLGKLRTLTLASNGITRLEKGVMKYLDSVNFLDISGNPIKRLNNGALFGISKSETTTVSLTEGSLELLQGGLFDDA